MTTRMSCWPDAGVLRVLLGVLGMLQLLLGVEKLPFIAGSHCLGRNLASAAAVDELGAGSAGAGDWVTWVVGGLAGRLIDDG